MENSILQEHPEGGLRKIENSRLVGIEKGHNLGITILFGHRMTMTQLNDEEVGNLVNYLTEHYPQLFKSEPDPDLVKQRDDAKELCEDALERMKELKDVIRVQHNVIDGYLSGAEGITKVHWENARSKGKEALD